jgi:shikimate kinase
MGSGKTHWGIQLAERLKLPSFDLDDTISAEEKRSIPEIFAESGEEYFRIKEKETLEKLVEEHPSMVLSCGGGAPCYFNNIEFMKKSGTVVWLNTHISVLLKRLLREKASRPLIRSLNDDEMKGYIIKKLNQRRMYYEQADVVIDNEDSISISQFIQTVLHA